MARRQIAGDSGDKPQDIVARLQQHNCQTAACWEAAMVIELLRNTGDELAEQLLTVLGPLSTDADYATVEKHRYIRAGAIAKWAEVRRG